MNYIRERAQNKQIISNVRQHEFTLTRAVHCASARIHARGTGLSRKTRISKIPPVINTILTMQPSYPYTCIRKYSRVLVACTKQREINDSRAGI